jgi:hypothetical protein
MHCPARDCTGYRGEPVLLALSWAIKTTSGPAIVAMISGRSVYYFANSHSRYIDIGAAICQRCYFPTDSHDQPKRMPNEAANPTGQTGFCDMTQKP